MAINETAIGAIPSLVNTIKALVGGLFGLYVILVILRWYESKRLVSIMKDIRHDLREMSKQQGMMLKERETIIRKLKKKEIKKKIGKKLKRKK